MQSANKAAPEIIAALQLLGNAKEEHVSFAMLGLGGLQAKALEAVRTLRPVAARLASRKIACDLRIEMAQLRRASQHADVLTNRMSWNTPQDVDGTGDILNELTRLADSDYANRRGDLQWPARLCIHRSIMHSSEHCAFEHYAFIGRLAVLNHAWNDAVREWRRQPCKVVMIDPNDADVRQMVRLAPNIVELQLHPKRDGPMLDVGDNALAAIQHGCPRLERLLMRGCDEHTTSILPGISVQGIINLVEARPTLKEMDLVSIYSRFSLDDAAVLSPALRRGINPVRMYLSLCDSLYNGLSLCEYPEENLVTLTCDAMRNGGRVCEYCKNALRTGYLGDLCTYRGVRASVYCQAAWSNERVAEVG